jgi:hypothetical protein
VDTRITLGRCVADSVVEAGNSSDELLVGTNVAVRIGDRVGDECPVFVLLCSIPKLEVFVVAVSGGSKVSHGFLCCTAIIPNVFVVLVALRFSVHSDHLRIENGAVRGL